MPGAVSGFSLAGRAGRAGRRQLLALGLGCLVLVEVTLAAGLSWWVDWSWAEALDSFVVTNGLIGLSFGLCGAVIAWFHGTNPIGWLLLADGLGHATTAWAAPYAQHLADVDAPLPAQRAAVTVFAWSWPWSIGLFLPLALLLFPTGSLPSPRWRRPAWLLVATAPLFVVEVGTDPRPPNPAQPSGYLTLPAYHGLDGLWTVSEVRTVLALGLAATALAVRFRRSDGVERSQLSWLLFATCVAVVFVVPWSLVQGTPIVVLFAIPLIPISIAVAMVRRGLFDIRVVVSRALTWLLLTLAVVAAYALLVGIFGTLVSTRVRSSAVATVVVALLAAPLWPRLQRVVDRAMYGDRRDPARVLRRVGEHLQGADTDLSDVAASLSETLRLPYVAIAADDRVIGSAGSDAGCRLVTLELRYGGEVTGWLTVGLRPGERELSRPDSSAVSAVAAPLGVAVHAMSLASELQDSRERLVSAREEERRRLRRDLHDGIGPTLTGLALAADAAANLQYDDPERAASLLQRVRTEARLAIGNVRQVVDDLRPASLDELGLVGALRQRTEQAAFRADGAPIRVTLHSPASLPALPAALEVAAYRVAVEGLTNVLRHAAAERAEITLRYGDTLDVEVLDDGPPNGPWRAGVGLQAMRERTDELGGRFAAGPSKQGGRVRASFPLGAQ